MIGIVDYGAGNLHSVANALDYLDLKSEIVKDPNRLKSMERIVLPGVGAFGSCMQNLSTSGFVQSLQECVFDLGKPFFGICVGMQLLATEGEEFGLWPGLNWIGGKVEALKTQDQFKVPHVGWNEANFDPACPLFDGFKSSNATFYFVHSYHFNVVDRKCIASTTNHGTEFVSAVWKDNIFASQFHPEKSQRNGLKLLENFSKWKP